MQDGSLIIHSQPSDHALSILRRSPRRSVSRPDYRMLCEDEVHKVSYIMAIVVAAFITMVVIMLWLLATGIFGDLAIFPATLEMVFEEYDTGFTPAIWTFPTLSVLVILWQVLWLIYGVTTVCRFTSYGYMYIAPGHMHPSIYCAYSAGLLFYLGWIILMTCSFPTYATILAACATFCLAVAVGCSSLRIYHRGPILQREGVEREAWYVRWFLHNGVAAYATWCFLKTLMCLDISLAHFTDISTPVADTIVIGLLFLAAIVYFFVDIMLVDKFVRYTLSPYLVITVFLAGCLCKNWNPHRSQSVLTAFAFAVIILEDLVKLGLVIYRHAKKPIWSTTSLFLPYKNYGSVDFYREPYYREKDFY